MLRQCAWCLRLINSEGDRLSPLPKPKLYEASHGICSVCAMHCMEQMVDPIAYCEQDSFDYYADNAVLERRETPASLTLQFPRMRRAAMRTGIVVEPTKANLY
jgi:hypothetical protein